MTKVPERIYLQTWADPVTWCEDRIDGTPLDREEEDVEYVRADLYDALEQDRNQEERDLEECQRQRAALEQELDSLKKEYAGLYADAWTTSIERKDELARLREAIRERDEAFQRWRRACDHDCLYCGRLIQEWPPRATAEGKKAAEQGEPKQ
jgi:hypothetical protein